MGILIYPGVHEVMVLLIERGLTEKQAIGFWIRHGFAINLVLPEEIKAGYVMKNQI
jgi:hypothetical protein